MTATGTARLHHLRWLIPVLFIIGWVAFLGAGGTYAGMLGQVVKNDNAAFLPADAEATQVAQIEPGFFGAEQIPAVVVYARDSGITDADRSAVTGDIEFIRSVEGVAGQVAGPIPATDGRALQIVVPLSTTGDATVLPNAVMDIRGRAQSHPGLTAHVTGPGGMAGDLGGIFEDADVRLLTIALIAVFIILVLVYRSIILPIVVLLTAQLAQTLASVAVYLLARADVINLNGQSQGALILICIGTATDYALLIVGRYREELRDRESRYEAILVSVRRSAPTIIASGITVIVAMMCLLLSELSSNRGYGPVLALGICASLIATFTFLPAVLALLGRVAFWPVRPTHGSEHKLYHGLWGRAARVISHRPRVVWVGTAAVLVALAAFLPSFKASGSPMSEAFLSHPRPDSVIGLDALGDHYPGGAGAPALIVGPASSQAQLIRAAQGVAGVEQVTPYSDVPGPNAAPKVIDGQILLQATLSDPSDSSEAEETVTRLRDAVHAADGRRPCRWDHRHQHRHHRRGQGRPQNGHPARAGGGHAATHAAAARGGGPTVARRYRGPQRRRHHRGRGDRLQLDLRLPRPRRVVAVVLCRIPHRRRRGLQHLPDGSSPRGKRPPARHPRGHRPGIDHHRRCHHLGRRGPRRDILVVRRAAVRSPGTDRLHHRRGHSHRHLRRPCAAGARPVLRHRARHLVALEAESAAGWHPERDAGA